MNICARCEKTVYPIEEFKCLDKVWHKGCFKCQECGMVLNMKTYKGYNKMPYCNAHVPQARHTAVADTPEARRLAENTRIQSNIKYHEDFEKLKGKVTQVADDPETVRIRNTSKIISNVTYHGEYEKKKQMEEKRSLLPDEQGTETSGTRYQTTENRPANQQQQQQQKVSKQQPQQQQPQIEYHPPPQLLQQPPPQPLPPQIQQQQQPQQPSPQPQHLQQQKQHQPLLMQQPHQQQYQPQQQPQQQQQQPIKNNYYSGVYGSGDQNQNHQLPQSYSMANNYNANNTRKDNLPYNTNLKSTVIYTSEQGPVSNMPARKIGSIADYDPLNDNYGSIATNYRTTDANAYYEGSNQNSNASLAITNQQMAQGNLNGISKLSFRAMYDYSAQDDDEVSFNDGDIIKNCISIDEGWMIGTIERTNKRGMLPANYVEVID